MNRTASKQKTPPKRKSHALKQEDSQREAFLEERHDLQKLFPGAYSPQIGIFTENRVEVILTFSRAQAENLARLLKEHKL